MTERQDDLPPLARIGNVKRVSRFWKPFEAVCMSSAYGMAFARGWTRRQAMKRATAAWMEVIR